jgi:site-specific DNA-cytosine methylase
MLDLFCGTKSMEKAFKRAGWETYTVDWNPEFEPTWCGDVNELTVDKIIEICDGVPDFVHLSPDGTSYSVAAIGHHRKKNKETGELEPQTEYAKFCDNTNAYIIDLIVNKLKPKFYTIENPRSGMRKMKFIKAGDLKLDL